MGELISRQSASNALEKCCKHCCREDEAGDRWIHYETALNEIEGIPSAQPEIIHCEDCKYGMLDPSFPHQWFCKYKGDEWNNGDYFCGHARKREETT